MSKTPWQDRKHSAAVCSRYFSGGFEFETAEDARDWASRQHERETVETLAQSSFTALVCSNGVAAQFYHSPRCMEVQTTTYQTTGTMRDRSRVSSPSDCVWIVPGTDHYDMMPPAPRKASQYRLNHIGR